MKFSVLLLASAISGFAFAETTTTNATTSSPTINSTRDSSFGNSNSLSSPSDSSLDSRTGSSSTAPASPAPYGTAGSSYSTGSSSTAPSTSDTTNMNSNNSMNPAATTGATSGATTDTTSRTYREETTAAPSAYGGFYIEPGIFGSRTQTDLKTSQLLPVGDVNGTSDGVGVDLKVGGHINDIVFLAVDGRYERSHLTGSAYSSADSNVYNYGPTLGFQAPVWGMRLWGTYVLDGISDPQAGANSVDFKFKDPYGWRAGVGFHIQNVSLNLEYEDLTYRTTELQSRGTAAGSTNTSADFGQRGYLASLSFPISL